MLLLKNPAHLGSSSLVATLIVKESVSFVGKIADDVELISRGVKGARLLTFGEQNW